MSSRCAARVLLAMSVILAGSACTDALGPAADLVVLVSAPHHFVTVGDTIQLAGVAYNGSKTTIEASRGCGPGIGFIVADSTGVEADLYSGPWTCPVRDSNILEPGETDIVEWPWSPPASGVYLVQSVVWVRDGPEIRSRPVEVTVID